MFDSSIYFIDKGYEHLLNYDELVLAKFIKTHCGQMRKHPVLVCPTYLWYLFQVSPHLHLYIYIYMYVCMYVCMYECKYIYIHIFIYINIYA